MLDNYTGSELNRISLKDGEYISDVDQSFWDARIKTKQGFMYINDKSVVETFLNHQVSAGDIIIIPEKVDYIELIGGVKNPGIYKYKSDLNIRNYIYNAGGYTDSKRIYLFDNITGTKHAIDSTYIPKPGDVIFIQGKSDFRQWDRTKDIFAIIGTLATILILLTNLVEMG